MLNLRCGGSHLGFSINKSYLYKADTIKSHYTESYIYMVYSTDIGYSLYTDPTLVWFV